MKVRILSAIVALPFIIIPLYFGGWLMSILVLSAIFIGLWEFNRAFQVKDKYVYALQCVMTVGLFALQRQEKMDYVFAALVLLLVLTFVYYLIQYPKVELKTVFIGIIGYIYISVMMSHIVLIRNMQSYGQALTWLILIIAFGSDSFAYFSGVFLGKHKLAPKLSPNKTIEGAIGGMVGTGIVMVIYMAFILSETINLEAKHIVGFMFLGMLGSVFGQFGDMAASAMKRETKIKDFGTLIPGHGGIVDRMDSIIFVAPFVYYVALFIVAR